MRWVVVILLSTAVVCGQLAPHVRIVIQGSAPTVPALVAAELVRRLIGSFTSKDR